MCTDVLRGTEMSSASGWRLKSVFTVTRLFSSVTVRPIEPFGTRCRPAMFAASSSSLGSLAPALAPEALLIALFGGDLSRRDYHFLAVVRAHADGRAERVYLEHRGALRVRQRHGDALLRLNAPGRKETERDQDGFGAHRAPFRM